MYIELIEELNTVYSTEPSLATQTNNLTESDDQVNSDNLLYVPVEGVHSVITKNYTYYEPNCLKESAPLWTTPYGGIPVIYHHKEHDSKIIGRIKSSEYIQKSKRSGTPALKFIFGIGDKEGKEGIQNGTLRTVSIGARAKDLRCSICGKNIAREGFCEHERGRLYEGKLCYWVVKNIEPKEISYVIVPSDQYAYSEKPIASGEVVSMAESNNEKEVNDLSKNIFEDVFSKALAEAQEDKIKNDAEQAQNKPEPEPAKKPDEKDPVKDPKVADPEPEPKQKEEPKKEPDSVKEPENKEPEPKAQTKEDEPEDKAGEDKPKEDPKKDEPKNEDDDNAALREIIKGMEKKISDLSADLQLFKNKYKEEKELRESAERDKIKIENIVKQDLVEKINDLRTSFGLKEKDKELQMGTSIDILESEYSSLSEISSSSINCVKTIQKVKSAAIVDDKLDNTNKQNLKESEQNVKVPNLADMFSNFTKR